MCSVVHNNKTLTVYIDPDDHVSMVFKKIAYHLGINSNDIYMWTYQPVHTLWQLNTFLDNIFKGENLIDISSFVTTCFNAFNIKIKLEKGTLRMLTREMALEILKKHKPKQIVQPIGHYFMDGEYIEYLPYKPPALDPALIAPANVDALYMNVNMTLTIESVLGFINNQVLHVVSKRDVDHNHKLYFPFQTEHKNLKKFIKYVEESENAFVKEVNENIHNASYVSMLYFKIKPLRSYKQANLSVLFNNIHITEDVPFVKYKSRTNVYHKVYKQFLAKSQEVHDFERWYNVDNFKMQENTYILLKLKYKSKGYITLILNDKLQTDVRLNFHVKDEVKIEKLKSITRLINNVVKRMHLPIEELPNDVQTLQLNYDIARLVTYNISSLDIKANQLYAESFVKTKMFHYFDVLPSDITNILRLQYKKVDNFGRSENISIYIQYHSREPREEVIRKVAVFFTMSEEEAENEYEKWELQRDSDDLKPTEQIKYERYVEVKIRFNSPIDVKYFITGTTSIQQNDRIIRLIGHILESSTNKTRELKKDLEAKRLLEEEMQDKKIVPIEEPLNEDDDNWMAELNELENEFQEVKQEDVKKPSSDLVIEEDKEIKLKGFVKRMLDSADRNLFNYKSEGAKRRDYTSLCGWVDRRQPVVITHEEKQKIDKMYPGAYDGYVKSGSTPELEKRNYYICPKVWCPRSRVAVPPALYKEKGKDACPVSEEPIIFESKSFWGLGDKSFDRNHIPGFLAKHTRSDGLCLPCCFKIAPSEGNRNKQRQDLCVPKLDENEEIAVDDFIGAEKYIKGDTYFPLEIGRYGLLPRQLHEFLGKQDCGSRHNGTGLMNDKTNCYLRKGIFHGSQSFIHCLISCMENPKVTNYKEFIELLNRNLTVSQYILLENGKVLQLFIDRSKSIFSTDFEEFRQWMLKENEYVARFNLLKLQKELEKVTEFTKEIMFYKDIIREFMIYYSYKNFVNFMNMPELEKDHRILLDLFNISTEWLNINEYNFVVLDIDTEGKVHIDCSLNRDTSQFVNKKTPFVLLVKYGRFYEPLCHVKTVARENIYSTFKFSYQSKEHQRIRDVLTFYYNNCSTSQKQRQDINIPLFLESKGYKPKYYVIDYDFRLCGLILSNNMYIPFIEKEDVFSLKGLRFVYISDVVLFKCLEDRESIKQIFNLLSSKYGTFYTIEYIIADGERIHGVVLQNGTFVPINLNSSSPAFKSYTEDLYLFINEQEEDERTRFMSSVLKHDTKLNNIISGLYANLDQQTKLELMFLKDPKNPLPLDFKRVKMMALIEKALKNYENATDADLLEVADIVLNKFTDARKVVIKKFKTSPDEVLFDYNDVQEGKLTELAERAQNPYKLFHKKLNDMFEKYVFEEEADDDEFTAFINEESTFSEVPVKYGNVQYRKMLKGFNVLETGDESDTLYRILSAASAITKKTPLSVDILKSVIKTNVVKDFKAKTLETFSLNPCYINHLKKMKIKEPTLDTILEIINSIHYRPSFYEIRAIARAIDLNIILIGRQNLKNPNGLFEVVYTRSPFYMFLIQSYNRVLIADMFNVIVKNKKDIILSKSDLPTELIEMMNTYLSDLRA